MTHAPDPRPSGSSDPQCDRRRPNPQSPNGSLAPTSVKDGNYRAPARSIACAVEGLICEDISCPSWVTTTVHDTHVELKDDLARAKVNTSSRLVPGSKVETTDRLRDKLPDGLIARYTPGGGNFNVASALAHFSRRDGRASLDINVIDAGKGELPGDFDAHYCGTGVFPHRPNNLVIPLPGDRGIIKEHLHAEPAHDLLDVLEEVSYIARESDAVISASSKVPQLAEALFDNAPGAKYLNPTGSLPGAATRRLLSQATDVVMNFNEAAWIAGSSGLRVDGTIESQSAAAHEVAVWLHGLKRRGIAGHNSAVVTLGANGCVVADWTSGQVAHLILQVSPEAARPNRCGTGDRFLAAYVLAMETWARRSLLEAPAECAAAHATRWTCSWLGIPDAAFDLRIIRI
jgi:hypothetical protein